MEENKDENEQGSFRRNLILKEKNELKQKFSNREISYDEFTKKNDELDAKLDKYSAETDAEERTQENSARTDEEKSAQINRSAEKPAAKSAEEESATDKEIEIEEVIDEKEPEESHEKHHHHEHHGSKHHTNQHIHPDGGHKSSPFWMILTVILAILLVISIAYFGELFGKISNPTNSLDKQVVADKVINYVNSNVLTDGSKATLISVEENSGVYAIKISLSGNTVDAYATKDGTMLFPAALEVTNGSTKPIVNPTKNPANISFGKNPVLGPDTAKVTIIEFSDYQCPYCAKAETTIREIYAAYNGSIRIAYRNFPLPARIHPYAQKAAEASECANEQGKFWEYHNMLFDKQAEWSPIGYSKFKEYAVDLGLNETQFNDCLDSGKYASAVADDAAQGSDLGVSGTPAFFINGQELVGAQPFSAFKTVIDAELAK